MMVACFIPYINCMIFYVDIPIFCNESINLVLVSDVFWEIFLMCSHILRSWHWSLQQKIFLITVHKSCTPACIWNCAIKLAVLIPEGAIGNRTERCAIISSGETVTEDRRRLGAFVVPRDVGTALYISYYADGGREGLDRVRSVLVVIVSRFWLSLY